MPHAGNKFLVLLLMAVGAASAHAAVELGIDVLVAKDYDILRGKRVGLRAINVYTQAEFSRQLRTNLISRSSSGKREMFFKCYGSASIAAEIARGGDPDAIVAGWSDDVRQFQNARSRYLLY